MYTRLQPAEVFVMAVVHLSPELPRISVRGHKREPSEPIDFLSASYEGEEASGQLQRSFSGRPRSRSTSHTLGASNGKQRKSLRGLGRSSNKTKQGGEGGGGNRRSSASEADHGTTQQIDSAFTKIREQLVSKHVH